MTYEEFEKIMGNEEISGKLLLKLDVDNALDGLKIIQKYCPNKGVEAADHDIIYSVSVSEIVDAGITKEDAEYLSKINWMIDEDSLACFV